MQETERIFIMPKTILLIRHAKAQPFGLVRCDYDRTLDPRGVLEARKAGAGLRKRQISPQLFIASPAPRALYTLRLILTEMKLDPEQIVTDRSIYEGDLSALLNLVRAFPDDVSCAMFCGHNPGISELVGHLYNSYAPAMSTCEVVGLTLETDCWMDAGLVPAVCDFRITSGQRA